MTIGKVETEYSHFLSDLRWSLSGGFCSLHVKCYTFSCVKGKNSEINNDNWQGRN